MADKTVEPTPDPVVEQVYNHVGKHTTSITGIGANKSETITVNTSIKRPGGGAVVKSS
jgi:hypothetical protein